MTEEESKRVFQSFENMRFKNEILVKENAELKAQIKSIRMEKGILVAKLKSYEALWNEQQKAIKEKQAQIEKMKCCGNCSKSCFAQDCEDIVNRCDYSTSDSLLFKCGEWELAE